MPEQPQSQVTEREVWLGPLRPTREARSSSNASSASGNVPTVTRAGQVSFAPSLGAPGAFSTDLKLSVTSKSELDRPELFPIRSLRSLTHDHAVDKQESERVQAELKERIEKETKIKSGYENLLEALNSKNAKHTKDQRQRVESIESELHASERKITQLKLELEAEVQRAKSRAASPAGRLSQLFKNTPTRSPSRADLDEHEEESEEDETESPTFVLAETLQALEAPGMSAEYYVEHANSLVDLFKRHPTLKYDLVWSEFGLRMQILLINESHEVVAAGFRVLRHSISDRKSLSIIRSLHTDEMVILSLVRVSKASVQREQALKFVRAFLDVKDGVQEISRAVVRVIVAVAEHHEDRMQNICILTLAELMIRAPALVVASGGMGPLCDALADGKYDCSDSLISTFLFLMETPSRRKYLQSGHELTGLFAAFTDGISSGNEAKLRSNAAVISALLKTWPGMLALGANGFVSIKSLCMALYMCGTSVRDIILELFFDVLKIKQPSWSSSFLAGRRLTTYGRVNLKKKPSTETGAEQPHQEASDNILVENFTATMLAMCLQSGLLAGLLYTTQHEEDSSVKRKSTLLLGEILNMAHEVLPGTWSMKAQVLPDLFKAATLLDSSIRGIASSTIYHIDSVNRTLYRTGQAPFSSLSDYGNVMPASTLQQPSDKAKGALSQQIEEGPFRSVIMETGVLNSVNFVKWDWGLIEKIIEGPLQNSKRLEEAIKTSKFVKRLMGFYRPFKFRFSDIRNSKPNQRYVRIGCSLFRTLLETPEGTRYLAEHKLLAQIAECLAQVDRLSGLTSADPIFSAGRLSESLVGGYFVMLGVLSSYKQGLRIMEHWKMANMFYHIIELEDRDDLIKALLGNIDYTIDSHLRVILSKALTSCSSIIRVFATRLLRKYAIRKVSEQEGAEESGEYAEWAIRLLTTQLYDPDIEVSEVAIRILEETCNNSDSLEFVVRCRPSLEHLGEIAAPLLLRFLSSSIGYHYLDGLDYISQEMDDWFLGRNDSYVLLVEASLAKVLSPRPDHGRVQQDEFSDNSSLEVVPPHFYRELTRTREGCKLLENKGHFDEFVHMIFNHGLEKQDVELMLKVKGCLWAVGNIGSMELGAPFLEKTEVIKKIIDIATLSEVMSMRGTAFFALGLISMSVIGQETLASYGWDSAVNELGQSIGVCIPVELKNLFVMRPLAEDDEDEPMEEVEEEEEEEEKEEGGTKTKKSMAQKQTVGSWKKRWSVSEPVTDSDPINARILALVTDLSNTPLTKSRARELRSIKAKKAPGFQQARFFRKVMALLEQHRYRFPVMRFVIDLFDKNLIRKILFEEDEDEDEDSDYNTMHNDGDNGPIKINSR